MAARGFDGLSEGAGGASPRAQHSSEGAAGSSLRAQHGPSGLLREALVGCAAAGLSGLLRVTGEPGGTVHLTEGKVAAILTPGAPSAEVILLRSRHVTESTWDAAFAATAATADAFTPGPTMGAELVTRAALGRGELEALLRTALADAMFVLASGVVEECRAELGAIDCLLPLEPGAEVDPLLAEASRRMAVLGTLPAAVVPDRERVVAVPGAVRPGGKLGHGQDEILALADGRRTPRDMAFALGWGVYATMLRLAQMRDAGVLTTTATAPAPRPEPAAGGIDLGPLAVVASQPDTVAGLPVRRKGRSAQPRRSRESRAGEADGEQEPSAPHRLLRPRAGKSANPGPKA